MTRGITKVQDAAAVCQAVCSKLAITALSSTDFRPLPSASFLTLGRNTLTNEIIPRQRYRK